MSNPFLKLQIPWHNNANVIWLASTLHLYRNVADVAYPGKLSADERSRMRDQLVNSLLNCSDLDQPYFVRAEETGPLEKEFLYEHFLAPRTFQQAMGGEGFVIDKTGTFIAIINVKDHLQLQVTDTHERLEETWCRLYNIEQCVAQGHEFDFTERFGYLTSDPMQCGTGLVGRLYLHLPALVQSGSLPEIIEKIDGDDIEAVSVHGDFEDITGDIVVVQNRCTLGLSEEKILQALRTYAFRLMVAEKRLRNEARASNDADAMDKISRAFGLATHSYNLETLEAWSALSLLKMGVDMGWVAGVDQTQLNALFFDTRRAHLNTEYGEEIPPEKLSHRRAEFVHQSLSGASLKI